MNKSKMISIIAVLSLSISNSFANETASLDKYLKTIKTSGELRLAYLKKDNNKSQDTSATALGGVLKFEFPTFNDNLKFNLAGYYSSALSDLSGDVSKNEFNEDLTNENKSYATFGEANLSYSDDSLLVRVGRQIVNTPLLGDDEFRMHKQTFEGSLINYKIDSFSLTAAYLTSWQGADTGVYSETSRNFNEFQALGTAQTKGVSLIGIDYEKQFDKKVLNSRAYYYDINKYSKVFYADVSLNSEINDNSSYDIAFQFSKQNEKDNSGVEGTLYGVMLGYSYDKLYISSAYTKSKLDEGKQIFNGFGGEFYYTAMNEYVMGYLSAGEDEKAINVGLSYDISDKFNISTYVTEFKSSSDKIVESDIYLTYVNSDNLISEFTFANIESKKGNIESYNTIFYRTTYIF